MSAALIVTASQVGRLVECPGGGMVATAEDPAPAAERGTAVHARLLRPETFPAVFRAWTDADGADGVAGCRTRGTGFEAAFLREGEGPARLLGFDIGRAYGEPEDPALAGTADVVRLVRAGGRSLLRVADLKTGHSQVHGGLPEPAEAWQLRTLAYLAWDASGRPEHVEVRLAWLLHDEGEDPPRQWVAPAPEPFGAATLREWEGVLLSLLRRLAAGEVRGRFRRGGWCLSCSAFDFCDAQRDVLERVASRPYTPKEMGRLPPEELADLWLDVQCAGQQVERARASLLTHVEAVGSVPLGRDRELIPARTVSRRVRDVARLKEEAERRGVPAREVVREGASLEAVRAAFAAAGAGDADGFLSEMESAGVIERTASRPFLKERRARRSGRGG